MECAAIVVDVGEDETGGGGGGRVTPTVADRTLRNPEGAEESVADEGGGGGRRVTGAEF